MNMLQSSRNCSSPASRIFVKFQLEFLVEWKVALLQMACTVGDSISYINKVCTLIGCVKTSSSKHLHSRLEKNVQENSIWFLLYLLYFFHRMI